LRGAGRWRRGNRDLAGLVEAREREESAGFEDRGKLIGAERLGLLSRWWSKHADGGSDEKPLGEGANRFDKREPPEQGDRDQAAEPDAMHDRDRLG